MKLTIRRQLALLLSLLSVSFLSSKAAAERAEMTLVPNVLSINDMSSDGRYLIGTLKTGEPYLWDSFSDTWTILPGNGRSPAAVSEDGTTVVGAHGKSRTRRAGRGGHLDRK